MSTQRLLPTYEETIRYLYDSAPMFQNVGAAAYKEGMKNSFLIDDHLQHPHAKYHTIHVGGTNGKGSTCHLLASILQEAGYKVGLYTSPHLLDFRERIRVNGQMIDSAYVVRFVAANKKFFKLIQPSFFELTTGMAFAYFAAQAVDVAIIEVGLGGRLDCTNVITPVLSVITNISLDHTNLLGKTLTAIAKEKAGIIKPGVPAIIGEAEGAVKELFASASPEVRFVEHKQPAELEVVSPLQGYAQGKNTALVLSALGILKNSFNIPPQAVVNGFANVIKNTGLTGRWQIVQEHPKIVMDIGHNVGGIAYNVRQLESEQYDVLHIVFGMMRDKDITAVLQLLPIDALYYFTQADIPRALEGHLLARQARVFELKGTAYPRVSLALTAAKKNAQQNDLIFVGGSTFVVAEALEEMTGYNAKKREESTEGRGEYATLSGEFTKNINIS